MPLSDKLDKISVMLEDRRLDDEDRAAVKERLQDLQRESYQYRSEAEYIAYVEAFLGRAAAIRLGESAPAEDATTDVTDFQRIDDVDQVDWRQQPLCGCGSPTCTLKQGELPSACRDASDGLLDPRAATERVKQHTQRHAKPYALRLAHRTWVSGYANLLAEAEILEERARYMTAKVNPHSAIGAATKGGSD